MTLLAHLCGLVPCAFTQVICKDWPISSSLQGGCRCLTLNVLVLTALKFCSLRVDRACFRTSILSSQRNRISPGPGTNVEDSEILEVHIKWGEKEHESCSPPSSLISSSSLQYCGFPGWLPTALKMLFLPWYPHGSLVPLQNATIYKVE